MDTEPGTTGLDAATHKLRVRLQRPFCLKAPPKATWLVAYLLALIGCGPGRPAGPPTFDERGEFYLQPLAVQQHQAYPHTVTGRFVSLIDFEPHPVAAATRITGDQSRHFSIAPAGGGTFRQVLDITRTGAGALRAALRGGATLIFRSPFTYDLRPYTLLSVAIHAPSVRDDLTLTLTGPGGVWQSRRRLIRPGWNTVLIDLNRLTRGRRRILSHFDSLHIRFADADEPITLGLDDIMLVDNRRTIPDTPAGLTLAVNGRDYTLRVPGWADPIRIRASADGLWRLGAAQPALQLTGPTHPTAAAGEDLTIMGDRRLGVVEIVEVNPLRVRIRNTWYFPPQAGLWIDMDVRRIRWDYTFYPDGRWVTDMLLNNAGGEDITTVRLTAPTPVAFADGRIGRVWQVGGLEDPAARCAMLSAPPGEIGSSQQADYATPAVMRIALGKPADAAGDRDGNGFDETQGCYAARAVGGNCRVELIPAPVLHRPVIRVQGPWTGAVTANCDGLALHPVIRLGDGVLVTVGTTLDRPAVVEFAGPVSILDE